MPPLGDDLRQQDRFSKLILPQEFISGKSRGQRDQPGTQSPVPPASSDGTSERLVFHRFDGNEGVSQLFEYRIEALSPEMDLDFDKMLGRNICVSYTSYQQVKRYFNGVLTEAEWIGAKEEKFIYRLVLRPWVWLLGRRANNKIFKNKTVPDIIKDVFDDNGFADYKFDLTHSFKPAEYIAQYRETDLAFVSRLMEEYGIYTYFKHTQDKHELNLIDTFGMHPKIDFKSPVGAKFQMNRNDSTYDAHRESALRKESGTALIFRQLTGKDRRDQEHISNWRAERRFRTGRIELHDFDYLNARKKMKAEDEANEKYQHAKLEVYEYRGRWADKDNEGDYLAKVKLEAEQSLDYRKFAAGDAANLYPGGYFMLAGHPTEDEEYLVVSASHAFVSQEYRSGGTSDEEQVYHGQYEVQLHHRPFRAPQITPKARIYGPQTAFVTTHEGVSKTEEIDVDEHGRIFVNFHWNRGDPNKDCSRAVRVAQMWAGKSWGWQVIPRVGMEVVVEFLDGDPDQPIVTGAVYNSDFKYPYDLPGEKTKSGVKTDSSPNNSDKGYNHFYFEDKAGSEEINVRAEKDLKYNIRNTETRHIAENYKGGATSPSRTTTLDLGSDHLTISNGNWKVNVTGNIEIKATQEIVIDAGGGASKITMNATGITIKAPTITLNGDGKITQKAPMIEIN